MVFERTFLATAAGSLTNALERATVHNVQN